MASLLFSTILFGQAKSPSYMSIGFKGGVNIINVSFEPKVQQDPFIGSNIGVFINYMGGSALMGRPWGGVQLEANYNQMGWNEVSDSINYKRTMNFMEFAFLSHFDFGKRKMRYIVDVGPYIAFQNSFSEEIEVLPTATRREYYGQSIDNTFDYGIMGGVGIGYLTKAGMFQVQFRYKQGLQTIFDRYPDSEHHFSYMRGMYAGFAYSYQFDLNKKSED